VIVIASKLNTKRATESRAANTKELEAIFNETQKETVKKIRPGQGPPLKGEGGRSLAIIFLGSGRVLCRRLKPNFFN
jgi:hypothetical protein